MPGILLEGAPCKQRNTLRGNAYAQCWKERTPPDTRLLVGVSGIPASGKSCLARIVVEKCNRMLTGDTKEPNCSPAVAILIGLDGWHLTRAQLDAMPDPKLAHDHRGAHWTFDANGFASFVEAIRKPLSIGGSVKAPTFDHAKKDPEFDAVEVLPHHTIVVIEGLYTFLSIGTWKAAGEALDERWFIDLGVEEAKRRLVARHVHTGVAKNMEEAIWRAEKNDMPSEHCKSHLHTTHPCRPPQMDSLSSRICWNRQEKSPVLMIHLL